MLCKLLDNSEFIANMELIMPGKIGLTSCHASLASCLFYITASEEDKTIANYNTSTTRVWRGSKKMRFNTRNLIKAVENEIIHLRVLYYILAFVQIHSLAHSLIHV